MADHGPVLTTVKALELGLRLRARREQLGSAASTVGKQTGIGGNNLSSIEIAKRKLTAAKLRDLARFYELSDDELAELEALRTEADRRAWWDDYGRLYSEEFLRYLGLEAGAMAIRQYAAETIPGLLQTGDYARAMVRGGSPYIKPVDVGPRVESRLARQSRIFSPTPAGYTAIVGQTALRQEVGSPEVMCQQLDRLIKIATSKEHAHIAVHVMPYSAGAHPVIGGGLVILSFDSPWVLDHAWQETVTTGNLLDKRYVVAELTASFDAALESALDRTASLEMIRQIRSEMEA